MEDIKVTLSEPELLVIKDTVRVTLHYQIPCDMSHYQLSTEVYLQSGEIRTDIATTDPINIKGCTSKGNKKIALRYQRTTRKHFFVYDSAYFDSDLFVKLTLTSPDGGKLTKVINMRPCCNDYIELAEPSLMPFIWGVVRPYDSEKIKYNGELTFGQNSADLNGTVIKDFVIKELDPDFFFSSSVNRIRISSYASIEGDSAYNDSLSARRGRMARNYILEKLTKYKNLDLNDMKVQIYAKGEAFPMFLKMLKDYYRRMPDGAEKTKLKTLLLTPGLGWDRFEQELKKLSIWSDVEEQILPKLRKSFFTIYLKTNPIAYKNLKRIRQKLSYFDDPKRVTKLRTFLESLNIHNLDVILLVTNYVEVKTIVNDLLIEMYPDELLFHINKGFLLLMDNKYDEGKAYFEKLIEHGYTEDRYNFLIPYIINYALAYLEYRLLNDEAAACYWEEMQIVDIRRRPMYFYTQTHDKLVWQYREGKYNVYEPIPSYEMPNEDDYNKIQEYFINMRLLHSLLTFQYNLIPVFKKKLMYSEQKPILGNAKLAEAWLLLRSKRITESTRKEINKLLREAKELNPRAARLISKNIQFQRFLKESELRSRK